jgi:hypothetical protein
MTQVSKINGIPVVDTFVTGTTFGSNQAVLTTNAGTDIFKLSGGTNITLTNPTGNEIVISSTGGGSFTNFIISDGSNTQTIDDGDTLLFSTNSGLTATLLLWDASSGLHKNIDWNQLPGAGGGEANTASNVGVGFGVFKQKTGVDLEFRSLSGGTNVTITTGDTIVISSTGGSSRITSSVTTTGNTPTELEKIDTLTDNTTNIVEVYVKAYESGAAEYGVWKRTLTVTKVSGTVVIREENADVDKTSSGLNANSISFTVNGGDIDLDVTGIAATTIDWESAYEIIL